MMNNFLSFQIHGGNDLLVVIAESISSILTFFDNISIQSPEKFLNSVLPGVSGLDNIHPLLVHFPIAFLSIFFVVDLVATLVKKHQWHQVASWFLYFGTISSLFTVIAGFIAANSVEHGENVHEIMEHHEHIGVSILILALILSTWRIITGGIIPPVANTLHLILSALLCSLILLGADLGAMMVYQYGVAVKVARPVVVSDSMPQDTNTSTSNTPAPITPSSSPIEPPAHHHHHHKHAHNHTH